MVLGRVVSGFGVGFLRFVEAQILSLPMPFASADPLSRRFSMIVPVYQSEVSPAHNRGLLGAVEFTGNIIGYASSVVRTHTEPRPLRSS